MTQGFVTPKSPSQDDSLLPIIRGPVANFSLFWGGEGLAEIITFLIKEAKLQEFAPLKEQP